MSLCLALAAVVPRESRAAALISDTVWQGLVEVTEEVTVAPGATLLILPGTTVRFADGEDEQRNPRARLLVQGTLLAQGRADAPILFTSAAAKPRPGDWGGIVLDSSRERPNRLNHCRIEYAREGIRAGISVLLLEDSVLTRNEVGFVGFRQLGGGLFGGAIVKNRIGLFFDQSTGFGVENCEVRGNAEAGAVLRSGSTARVHNCRFEDNGRVGVSCLQGASPVLEGNRISGHERGVYLELKSRPLIAHNEIRGNGIGIWAEKQVFPLIAGNGIAGNGVGIYCNFSGYPQIHDNNIYDNERFALVLGDNQSIHVEKLIPFRALGQFYWEGPETEFLPPKTRKFTPLEGSGEGIVDARGNWWGETATAQMQELGGEADIGVIEDAHDNPDMEYLGQTYPRDRVVYAPWEGERIAQGGRPEVSYAGLRGKVTHRGEPAAGARVFVYADPAEDFRGEGFAFSAPTGTDGAFSFHLAPGRYYLVAKRAGSPFPDSEPGPGELFGYYGGNPVLVSGGAVREVNVFVSERKPVERAAGGSDETGVLEGAVLGPEGPLEGAFLHVYPDASRDFRGRDLFGPQGAVLGGTGADGRFSVEVPPGRYFLVAAKRTGGRGLGPLQVGDFFGYFDGNPVAVAAGERRRLMVQAAEKARNTGGHAGSAQGLLGIWGVIRDPEGKVPQGVYAYASGDPHFMTGTMPPFRSAPVGPDGAYFVDLPGPGTYYVGARSGYGGPPLPGEWFGVHGEALPMPVAVEADAPREAVNITVRRME